MTRPLFVGLLLAAAAGCGKSAVAPPEMPPPPVTVARPVAHSVLSHYEYNGYLEAVETVQVRAQVKGVLTKVWDFKEGDDVKIDADLFTIDPRPSAAALKKAEADILKAKADYAKAKADIVRATEAIPSAEAQLVSARATVERLKRITDSASGEEMNKAVAAAAAAASQVLVAKATESAAVAAADSAKANELAAEAARDTAKVDLEYTAIKAPIAGRIGRALVTKGNWVGQGEATLLTTIVRMDKLYVFFDAPERDLVERLRKGQPGAVSGTIPIELGVATEPGFPHSGVIDFRDNRVDPGTGTIRVRGRFENPVGPDGKERPLFPGLFARVRVPAGPPRDLMVIPEDAIMTGQEGSYVYVVADETDPKTNEVRKNVVKKRSVTLVAGPPVWRTPTEPGWSLANPKAGAAPATTPLRSLVAVEKGLTKDDVVVVGGLQKARPGGPVTPDEWTLRGPAK